MSDTTAPVIVTGPTLSYPGLKALEDLRAKTGTQLEICRKIGDGIVTFHFRLFEDFELKILKKRSARKNGRVKLGERIGKGFEFLNDVLEGIFEDFSSFFWTLLVAGTVTGFAATGFAKIVLMLTRGTAATLPEGIAAWAGVLSLPVIGLSGWIGYFLWNLSPLPTSWRFSWERIPLSEYLPPLLTGPLLEKLEQLDTYLKSENIQAEFFINHGTIHDKDSLTKPASTVAKQGEQLKRWQQESAFLVMKITFPDGEKRNMTIFHLS